MGDNRLILHVGAPKCASSSLQAALSARPEFASRSGERFRYAAISNEGGLMTGEVLRRYSVSTMCRYAVSADANALAQLDQRVIAGIAKGLSDMLRDSSVILSCESWISTSETFQDLHLLDHIAFDSEVVAYVRPQPDFLNACWWQWAAWADGDFETWLYFSGFGNTCAWGRFLQSWAAIDGVSSVRPRLLSRDVVPGFFDGIGCDYESAGRSNRSLPGVALRFLQRNRELRLGMHDSDIDFALERALANWEEPSPWVLPMGYVRTFMEECRPDNEMLATMLPGSDRSAMLAEPRWWDPSCYVDRPVVSPLATKPDADEMDAFTAALATALCDRERELAMLRSERISQASPACADISLGKNDP